MAMAGSSQHLLGVAARQFKSDLFAKGTALGFFAVRVAPSNLPDTARARLRAWLQAGFHAGMTYMDRPSPSRMDASELLPGAQTVIVFAASYVPRPETAGIPNPPDGPTCRIATYALGRDYHLVLRERLESMLPWLEQRFPGAAFRICVDSAPLLERAFAVECGIGFAGRNTMVIAPGIGSFFFLAEILTDALIEPDPPVPGSCGNCSRCMEACPTGAIVRPYEVDSRRCISYLTIEKRTDLTSEEKGQLGGWAFGCDVCQDVCPYNKSPIAAAMDEFRSPSVVRHEHPLDDLLAPQSNGAFARRFAESPLLRPGRRRLQLNARAAARHDKA